MTSCHSGGVYKGSNSSGYACSSSIKGSPMRRRSDQDTCISNYNGFVIAVHVTGPVDADTCEGFDATISITQDGAEAWPTFRESSVSHKTHEKALSAGVTVARQKIDNPD